MGMNWLITGGCGFLGTSLIKRLMSEGGHSIRIVDNLSVGSREDLAAVCEFTESTASALITSFPPLGEEGGMGAGIQLIVGDILDDKLALAAAEGMDVIIHFAANTGVAPSVEDPRMDCVNNVIGTLNYLEAARHCKVKRFIFASSGAPVGEVEPPIHEEMAPHPVSPYGASKLAGEGYCSAYHRTFGVETVSLRFGNVYGPGSGHKSSVVAKFIRRALAGQSLEIYGNGSQTRDFIFIDDLIDGVWRAATMPGVGGETFQIATSSETSVRAMLEMLVPTLKRHGIAVPPVEFSEPRLGDVMRNFSDTSKARRILGWQCRMSLEEGLENAVVWFTGSR